MACDLSGGNTCGAGFHCRADSTCYAFCTQGGEECGPGLACSVDGRCEEAGSSGKNDNVCADVQFAAKPVTPSIELVLDRSGSMDNDYGNFGSRWEALKSAIAGANGIVTTLQAKAYFGATIYPGNGGNTTTYDNVDRGLNNGGAISAALALREPAGNTPTGSAVLNGYKKFQSNPAPAGSPPIIVLATDGAPTNDGVSGYGGQAGALRAVKEAYDLGIRTYIISVGADTNANNMRDLASAGQGVATGATYYKAEDPTQLASALNAVIGGVVSCQLDLSGTIDPVQASSGTVKFNGRLLSYTTDWKAVDQNTIEIIGSACDEMKTTASPKVEASFPCGAVIE